jgi:hypothetical protein
MAVSKWLWTHANPSTIHTASVDQPHNDVHRHWYTDYTNTNGSIKWPPILFQADDAQVQAAHIALYLKGQPSEFDQRVWNDIVDKIVELQIDWEVPESQRLNRADTDWPNHNCYEVRNNWSPYISSADPGYVTTNPKSQYYEGNHPLHYNIGRTLRAWKFNLCVNAFITLPSTWEWLWETDGNKIEKGTKAYGRYIIELTRAINHWCDQVKLEISPGLLAFDSFSLAPTFEQAESQRVIADIDATTKISVLVGWSEYVDIIAKSIVPTFAFKYVNPELVESEEFSYHLSPYIATVCNKMEMLTANVIQATLQVPITIDNILHSISSIPTSSTIRPDNLIISGYTHLGDYISASGELKSEPLIALEDISLITPLPIYPYVIYSEFKFSKINPKISSAILINSLDIRVDFVYNNIVVENTPSFDMPTASTTLQQKFTTTLGQSDFVELDINSEELSHSVNTQFEATDDVARFNAKSTIADSSTGKLENSNTIEFSIGTSAQFAESAQITVAPTFDVSTIITGIELVDSATIRKVQELDITSISNEFTITDKVTSTASKYINLFTTSRIEDTETTQLGTATSIDEFGATTTIKPATNVDLVSKPAKSEICTFEQFVIAPHTEFITLNPLPFGADDTHITEIDSGNIAYQRLVWFAGTHSINAEHFAEFAFQVPKSVSATSILPDFTVETNLQFGTGITFRATSSITQTATMQSPEIQRNLELGTIVDGPSLATNNGKIFITSRGEYFIPDGIKGFEFSATAEIERSTRWHTPVWQTVDDEIGLNIYQIHTVTYQPNKKDVLRVDSLWKRSIDVSSGIEMSMSAPLIVNSSATTRVYSTIGTQVNADFYNGVGWKYPYKLKGFRVITVYQSKQVTQTGTEIEVK